MRWKVILFNRYAQCGIGATGRTRRAAFDAAFAKARPEFRHYRFAEIYGSAQGADVQWLGTFNDARAGMRRGVQSSYYHGRRGMAVEIMRYAA